MKAAQAPASSASPKLPQHTPRTLQCADTDRANRFPETARFEFWGHLGKVGMGSGIYLGDGVVLTSAHVGCFPFVAGDGTIYRPVYDSWSILQTDQEGESDLAIFRIRIPDSDQFLSRLQPIPLAPQAPAPEAPVIMLGAGLRQNSEPASISNNGTVLSILGYRVDPVRAPLAGTNTVAEVIPSPLPLGSKQTYCFTTRFDRGGGEAQAADGDSGGGAFVYSEDRGQWELAGCIVAVSQQGKFIPFGSQTFIGDLSRYRDQIPSQYGEIEAQPSVTDSGTSPSPILDQRPIQEKPYSGAAPRIAKIEAR